MLTPSASHPSLARLPRLGAPARRSAAKLLSAGLGWLACSRQERLVLFLPMLILPTVAAARDLLLLTTLFLLVTVIEAALQRASEQPTDKSGLALGALAWLVAGLVLGTGAALTLALFVLVRSTGDRVPEALWPIRLGLAAMATALLVDLALIALALERSSLWLTLAAAIGTATTAARQLQPLRAEPCTPPLDAVTTGRRTLLEAALIVAAGFVLALYAALLAHEPALGQSADTGRFLALPLLAAAVVRLGWLGLEPAGPSRADPLAILLLAAWAVAGLALGGLATVA